MKNEKIVNIVLVEVNKVNFALNEMEKSLIKEFLMFLDIFEESTKYFQGRKYPTLSTNIVFYEKIMDMLNENSKKKFVWRIHKFIFFRYKSISY